MMTEILEYMFNTLYSLKKQYNLLYTTQRVSYFMYIRNDNVCDIKLDRLWLRSLFTIKAG